LLTLSEVGTFLERGAPALVRTGGGDDYPDLVLRGYRRYEDTSGREFDLLVFGDEADAVLKLPSVVDESDGESAIRAANAVAVFPTGFQRVPLYQAIVRKMRRLRLACAPGGESGEPELRSCASQMMGPSRRPVRALTVVRRPSASSRSSWAAALRPVDRTRPEPQHRAR